MIVSFVYRLDITELFDRNNFWPLVFIYLLLLLFYGYVNDNSRWCNRAVGTLLEVIKLKALQVLKLLKYFYWVLDYTFESTYYFKYFEQFDGNGKQNRNRVVILLYEINIFWNVSGTTSDSGNYSYNVTFTRVFEIRK